MSEQTDISSTGDLANEDASRTPEVNESVTGDATENITLSDEGTNSHGGTTQKTTSSTDKNEADEKLTSEDNSEVEMANAAEDLFSNEIDQSDVTAGGDFQVGSVDPVSAEVIDKLSNGFVQKFLPKLEKAQLSLKEVLDNQQILIESVEQEKEKFAECTAMEEVNNTMIKARQYCTKLVALKKEMITLHEKSVKLKKRAVKLQQQKQKEELQRAAQIEREHEKERMLNARIAKKRSDS
ncbi:biogenesis of lysosome-related organelles complex 1 subunit 6-like [Gigantopelta aegis]|uniref:biogenesis of lysosome-related organelles complex 1 subunit 6-like n=1 Tax=Gigantopelta aegis TaxID=1735272 RepID=UPI001B88B2F6|nr:biogenesis of lysosome-related organelles complex 1 subunit 6-like [Gigantopelta aegis]